MKTKVIPRLLDIVKQTQTDAPLKDIVHLLEAT